MTGSATTGAPPRVTVLMAVYNGETFLRAAMDSILGQTFADFEFVIVEDGSTDSAPGILAAYDDPRIRVLPNGRNIGLTPSLNVGLAAARGEFVARMDADDICTPERLERQVAAMDADPDLALVGSSYRLIDDRGQVVRTKVKPLDDFQARWVAMFRTPVEHSSAMVRRGVLTAHGLRYDESFRSAQDYDFWLRILDHGRGRVLPDLLLDYRAHGANITASPGMGQLANMRRIALANLDRRWPELAAVRDDFDALLAMYFAAERGTAESVRRAARAMAALIDGFCRRHQAAPAQRTWVRRQAAGILAEALLRRGRCGRDPGTFTALVRYAVPLLAPLPMRMWDERMAHRRRPRAGTGG
ncbi:MAG: glycosyltransferase [Hyphomicrobiales bacterium]|nr:glycosyltransferase [Hyphomicrobiales bacterium]